MCSIANNGALVKGSNFFEALSKTDTMVFDKTGTITEGRYSVTDVYPEGLSDYELLSIAATAEMHSGHPVAHALREASTGLVVSDDEDIQSEEIPGRGVKAIISGRQVLVGNAALLEENGVGYKVPTRSGAAIHVAVDNKYCGHILVTDRIRRGAFDAIESVRAQGVDKTVMLTGDVLSVARPIASKMNFDMLKAELLPEDKVAAVDYLISNKGGNGAVAFVGDGINDDIVMQTSNVGIAMGALGLEDAMESADILIMDENIGRLPMTLKAAKFTANIARENVYGMLGGELIILVLAALGLMPIALAALIDTALFIATMLNSLRPLNIWKEHTDE
jgi:Cd2+/Zn2+-exporting ATPase